MIHPKHAPKHEQRTRHRNACLSCRYITRPALCLERFSVDASNQILYQLKNPFRDDTTHVLFSPQDFMARIQALVPRPHAKNALPDEVYPRYTYLPGPWKRPVIFTTLYFAAQATPWFKQAMQWRMVFGWITALGTLLLWDLMTIGKHETRRAKQITGSTDQPAAEFAHV